MAAKRYLMADGKTWTDNYDDAGGWSPGLAAKVVADQAESACIIPDASGSWLVVNYVDPDLAEPEELVVYVILIGETNRIGGLYRGYDLAVKALEKHIEEQGYTFYKSAADTWVARNPDKGGVVVYQVVPYHVHTS